MRFLKAVFVLAGMIIGAGMFAIPFSFAQTGFWLGAVELAVLSGVMLLLHLLYGEIVLATPQFHRMPGYSRIYLGHRAAAVSWTSSLFGIIGTLVAYLIIGSLFLETVLLRIRPGIGIFSLVVGLACFVALITFFPLKKESAINGILTIFEIAFVAGLSLLLMRHVAPVHLTGVDLSSIFVPYGILLFALSGASVIPDLVTVLGREKRKVRAAIVVGSLIPAILYFFFAFAVVGVTGFATSTEAIAGLGRAVGGNVVLFASMAGFLAVLTSFIALSANFQAMLSLDLNMPRRMAWIAASAVPFLLYLAGFQNFIAIVSIVGVFAFGIDGILLFFMGRAVRKKQDSSSPIASLAGYAILAVILIGVLAQLLPLFSR